MSEDGSEETPPRPKRKIKKVVLLSSGSSSDSDESITSARTRRKRLRVLSDDGSESSGSSVVRAGVRRNRPPPKLRDSDGDSDTSGWATDRSDVLEPAPLAAQPASGFASDSSEGNSDKCSICLLRFTNQEVGTPESCEHIFCLDCITEWSKNVNTCPVDRITFDSIVVRSCAGGGVLRSEPVKVAERRPSIELLVTEDPTVCEVCGSTENEESMLLCDGCDLGFHMQCLTPPLTEVPPDQWLCPNCDELLSDVDIIFSGIAEVVDIDMALASRRTPRGSRGTRSRNLSVGDEPSTSTGRRGHSVNSQDIPSTSRGTRTSRSINGTSTTRHTTNGHRTTRRRTKRRRTKAVVIEYELQENGKFPVMKKVKRKLKKRKTKRRQPRTAARRTHVRASVRAKLASMTMNSRQESAQASSAGGGVQELRVRRQRAGIPALSLFGTSHQLDYFSDDDHLDGSEGASTLVASRPTSSILSAYRQARRKMIRVPSPPHASSAPDVLTSILESQTLLHSKESVVSITVDGNVNIKLETRAQPEISKKDEKKQEKVDLTQGEDAAKKAPSYPGQSRGGGWGGGYRGSYHREQNISNPRAGAYDADNRSGYQSRQGGQYNGARRDDNDAYTNYSRRPHYNNDDADFDRNRRPEQNRPNQPYNQRQEQNRYGAAAPWQPYTPPPNPRREPPPHHRHSFGGFDDPLDMRVGRLARQLSAGTPADASSRIDSSQRDERQQYRPLPEPPMFKYDKRDIEKSEDEKSDSGLVIDTEKYDPTEPTNDDDSGDEESGMSVSGPPAATPVIPATLTAPAIPVIPAAPAAPATGTPDVLPSLPPAPATAVESILAGIDTSSMNVPANVLDSAVRQVLKEHRNLIVAPSGRPHRDKSDSESDGDCPNFSIYSATSVHIANSTDDAAGLDAETPREPPRDNLEDLVQEDDETPVTTPESGSTPVPPEIVEPVVNDEKESPAEVPASTEYSSVDIVVSKLRRTSEQIKEKVSKRCPITTNVRNPIKIRLNTPSLIKRQVSLYDEEEIVDDTEETIPAPKEEEPGYKHSPEETKIMETKVIQRSESRKESTKSLYEDESIRAEVESSEKAEKMSALFGTEDGSPARGDVGSDKRGERSDDDEDGAESDERGATPAGSADDPRSDDEIDEPSGSDDNGDSASPAPSPRRAGDTLGKMTESISETEDERSYTPCLDENKSKDTSLETDKDKGIEGLDTEMISEDEGNEVFSDVERARSEARASPPKPSAEGEEGEIVDKKRETPEPEPKKKRKKEAKKEGKEKKKGKKGEIAFKKLSKSGKERNYRERDKNKDKEGKSKRERRESSEAADRQKQRRKERRKDLERYDVRSLVTEKRRRPKDAFGRDVSPCLARSSPSASPPPRSASRPRRSASRPRLSASRPRLSASRLRRSASRPRRSVSRPRRSASRSRRSPSRLRRSPSPPTRRRSLSRPKRSPTPQRRRSASRARITPPPRPRRSASPPHRSASPPRRGRPAPSPAPRSASRAPVPATPARGVARKRRRSADKRPERGRRRSAERIRKRKRSGSGSDSPRPKPTKKKKRARSERSASRRRSPRRRSPRRRRPRRRSAGREPEPEPEPTPSPPPAQAPAARSSGSVDSRLLSPRTPPPEPSPPPRGRRRRDPERARHRRPRDPAGPSKEVFTSGDNILVSVSFKEQERPESESRRERRRERRRRRRRAAASEPDAAAPRPVAIIDLERSPFRELTPSPRNVIVLSDSEPGDKEPAQAPAAAAASPAHPAVGPQTPPEPAAPPAPAPAPADGGPGTPPEPPDSPDAYDPYEPTRSASASPAPAPEPQRTMMTLETAQKTNMSADDVIDRRPLSPIEKVMALLQSTRDVSPEPPPGEAAPPPAGSPEPPPAAPAAPEPAAPAPPAQPAQLAPPPQPPVRIVLPSPTRSQPPKLFLAKPSPIKSDPIKPMQMQTLKASRLPLPPAVGAAIGRRREVESDGGDSPYSPGSSDFGDLFEPPGGGAGGPRGAFDALVDRPLRKKSHSAAKVPVKFSKRKGKTQVGVKIADDNLKILDELPSSAVELQVKSKFLKKLNRQERVVEEVKLVLKPHYNKKHVTKDEYKDILRRAVPKICHNKTGEINPAKIQSLVEAYVKKFRKKHKLGLA